jgi:hypothetical protein
MYSRLFLRLVFFLSQDSGSARMSLLAYARFPKNKKQTQPENRANYMN